MKKIMFLLLLAVPLLCFPQMPSQRVIASKTPALMRVVRSQNVGIKKNTTWETDYGSYSKDAAKLIIYDVTVGWNGKVPLSGVIQVFWIGQEDLSDRRCPNTILEEQAYSVTCEPRRQQVVKIISPVAESTTDNYQALGRKYKDGEKINGVVVRLIVEGHIIQTYTSMGHLKKYLWLPKFTVSDEDAKKQMDELKKSPSVPLVTTLKPAAKKEEEAPR